MLAEAKRETDRVLQEAREQAVREASQTEIVKLAEKQAQEIVDDARRQARETRLEMEDWADGILSTLEVNLDKFLGAVKRGRERLQERSQESVVAGVGASDDEAAVLALGRDERDALSAQSSAPSRRTRAPRACGNGRGATRSRSAAAATGRPCRSSRRCRPSAAVSASGRAQRRRPHRRGPARCRCRRSGRRSRGSAPARRIAVSIASSCSGTGGSRSADRPPLGARDDRGLAPAAAAELERLPRLGPSAAELSRRRRASQSGPAGAAVPFVATLTSRPVAPAAVIGSVPSRAPMRAVEPGSGPSCIDGTARATGWNRPSSHVRAPGRPQGSAPSRTTPRRRRTTCRSSSGQRRPACRRTARPWSRRRPRPDELRRDGHRLRDDLDRREHDERARQAEHRDEG